VLRPLIVGLYVGAATVGIFAIWYTHTEFMGIDLSQARAGTFHSRHLAVKTAIYGCQYGPICMWQPVCNQSDTRE
jgi:hypothetical protein